MPQRGLPNGPRYAQKRPEQDTVPLIDCGHTWCGRPMESTWAPVVVTVDDEPRGFCSAGCASRWLIRYELRAPA